MTVVGTGVGRYLRGLYVTLEKEFSDRLEISYFTGKSIVRNIPNSEGPGWKEALGRMLWRMPYPVAFGARLLSHLPIERRFRSLSRDYHIYHEAAYFPFKAAARMPTVFTIHDLSLLRYPQWHPRERVLYWRTFFKRRLGLADSFCAVSEFTKREMVEYLDINPELIRVTPLGVDTDVFNPEHDEEAQAVLESSGIPEEFILFVGSGDPRKNFDALVNAVEKTQCQLPLVSVGWSGWSSGHEKTIINMGYVSDRMLAQLYRMATMLVMPSEYEGFGLPVVEAMACGCPVVISSAAALVEVGGDAVIKVENVHDSNLLSCAIDDLAGSLSMQIRLSGLGLKRAASFSWCDTARGTAKVYLDDKYGQNL